MTEPDYYAVLGVGEHAPPEVIKAAYHALARKYHPDLNSGTTKLGTHFQEITRAYELLSDPLRRAAYDVVRNTARKWQPPQPEQQPPHPYWTAPRAPQQTHSANPRANAAPRSSPSNATSKVSHAGEPIGVLRRIIAVLIDIMVWTILSFLCYLLTEAVLHAFGVPISPGTRGDAIAGTVTGWLFLLGLPLYWLVSWATVGRTVGSVCMDARVSLPNGSRLGFTRSAIRLAACVVSMLPLGLGLWWAAWDTLNLTWHDKLSGSVVRRC